MYLRHYNLSAKPFSISSDPDFLWLGEKHKEAMAVLQYGVLDNKGFLLLTGDVGTGKTTLIQALLAGLRQSRVMVASVPDPGLEQIDFYKYIAAAFRFKKQFNGKGEFLIYFEKFLKYARHKQIKVLLILDEAQRMAPELLEEIRLLSNFENQGQKLLNIFFVGQNEFNDALLDRKNKALRQRITINYNLQPLTRNEVAAYIAHRLGVAGVRKQVIFTDKALAAIFRYTEGYPRRINILCDHALLTGYVKGVSGIDEDIIRECDRELRIPNEDGFEPEKEAGPPIKKRRRFFKAAAFVLVGFLVVMAGGYMYLASSSHQSMSPTRGLFESAAQKGRYLLDRLKSEETIAAAPTVPVIFHPVPKEEITLNPAMSPDKAVFPKEAIDSKPVKPKATGSNLEASNEPVEKPPPPLLSEIIIIHFGRNLFDLPVVALKELDRVADVLNHYPNKTAEIVGYSDSTGARKYNQQVSQFRADIIRSYLIGKGADPTRVESIGKGPENFVAANDTIAGRQQNRRVEIRVKDSGIEGLRN